MNEMGHKISAEVLTHVSLHFFFQIVYGQFFISVNLGRSKFSSMPLSPLLSVISCQAHVWKCKNPFVTCSIYDDYNWTWEKKNILFCIFQLGYLAHSPAICITGFILSLAWSMSQLPLLFMWIFHMATGEQLGGRMLKENEAVKQNNLSSRAWGTCSIWCCFNSF